MNDKERDALIIKIKESVDRLTYELDKKHAKKAILDERYKQALDSRERYLVSIHPWKRKFFEWWEYDGSTLACIVVPAICLLGFSILLVKLL